MVQLQVESTVGRCRNGDVPMICSTIRIDGGTTRGSVVGRGLIAGRCRHAIELAPLAESGEGEGGSVIRVTVPLHPHVWSQDELDRSMIHLPVPF